MKRTKLADRPLPNYSIGEEAMNTITHAAGALLGILALILCICRASKWGNAWGIVSSAIYGSGMIATFTVSAVYHGLKPGMAKKVLQVIDHCTIYTLIAGTYTVIVLTALRPHYPVLGWGLFAFEWGLALLAITLTAIDLKKYSVFSMVCYIGMGWAVLPFCHQILETMGKEGFLLLLAGGISYSIGSVLYGIGSRRKWMHSIFHVFVNLGAVLHFFSILLYAL